MTDVQTFNFNGLSVNALDINGEAYVIGREIASILGYTNTPKAIRDHVDEEYKLTERIVIAGQNRNVTLLNEAGVYSLALRSKLPEAKKFTKWVTSEVLPSIRKHGAYMTHDVVTKAIQDPAAFRAMLDAIEQEQHAHAKTKEHVVVLESEVNQLELSIEEKRPATELGEAITDPKALNRSMSEFSTYLNQLGFNTGRNRVMKALRDHGFLTRYNQPTQRSKTAGYLVLKGSIASNGMPVTAVQVTPKGIKYFSDSKRSHLFFD